MKKDFDFENHPWESFLFLDIETARKVKELDTESDLAKSFHYKMRYTEEASRKDFDVNDLKKLYNDKAALYPEYGRIVCITVGKIIDNEIVIYTFDQEEEKELIEKFMSALNIWAKKDPLLAICGVNIKFFDLRFIYIRSVVNGIKPIKGHISFTGLKPWEVNVADITDYWKQTSPYNAPLISIAECLDLPSPKDAIDGSEVSDTYWNEGKDGLKRIVEYCEKDVVTTINIARRLRFASILERKESKTLEEKIEYTNLMDKLFTEGDNFSKEDWNNFNKKKIQLSPEEINKLDEIIKSFNFGNN